MTREEVKDLFKSIIRKCDLVINNENYTDDEYVQGKIEDIAGMCHRALDGQFGEIIEPSLPSELDAAALKELQVYLPQGNGPDGICYFIAPQMLAMYKAGAEWMAGQGQTFAAHFDDGYGCAVASGVKLPFVLWNTYKDGDVLKVQIRKK